MSDKKPNHIPKALAFFFFLSAAFTNITFSQSVIQADCRDDLVLQVTYLRGAPPAFQRVGPAGGFGRTGLYSRFAMDPKWSPQPEALPARSVGIQTECTMDGVKVRVSVLTGKKGYERDEDIGDLEIKENEIRTITGLAKFGISPFEIKAIHNTRSIAILPAIDNQSAALRVGVESVEGALPTFKVNIRNTGDKAVRAIEIESTVDGRVAMSTMPRGDAGEMLIEPGELYSKNIPGTLKLPDRNGDVPEARSDEMIVIRSVVFSDGSFEGDSQAAATFHAMWLGERYQLENIVALFDKAISHNSSAEGLEGLRTDTTQLPDKIDKELFRSFVTRTGLQGEEQIMGMKMTATVSLRGLKVDVGDRVEEYIHSLADRSKPDAISKWLVSTRNFYSAWLDRLPK